MEESSMNNSKKIKPKPLESEDQPVSAIRSRLPREGTSEECIKVYCRVRPLEENQEPNNGISIVQGQHTMLLSNEDSTRPISKKYSFTEIFKDQPQLLVIQKLCDPVLEAIKHNHKGGLIFAYGVTSSGKTHTVLGSKEQPGILQYLFAKLTKPFRLTPVEVYNDEFYALTTPRNKIHLIESSGILEFKDFDGITVTKDNMESILQEIKNNRVQRSTNFNSKSSRSHAIFRIVTQEMKILGVVDLAGSERTREGCSMEETTSINRSLLSLGRCIKCLRQIRHNKNIQIPFRESRLTMALAEYFNTDFKLVMVVNINPAKHMVNQTINVLEYAAVARDIRPTTPTLSRYKNMSNSNRKMCLTLEQTKSEDFDNYHGKPSLTYSLKKCASQSCEVQDEDDERYKQLREFIIKMSLDEMRKNYYLRHQEVNKAFDFMYEREMETRKREIEERLDKLNDRSAYTRKTNQPELTSTCVNTLPLSTLESSFKRKTYQQLQLEFQQRMQAERQAYEKSVQERMQCELTKCRQFYEKRLQSEQKKRTDFEEAAEELHNMVLKREHEIEEVLKNEDAKIEELERRRREIQQQAKALIEFQAKKRQQAEELANRTTYEKLQLEVSKKIEMDELKRQLKAAEQKNQSLEQIRHSTMVQTGTSVEDYGSNKKSNLVSTLTSPFKFIKDSARNLKNSLGEIWGRLSPSKPQLSSEIQVKYQPQSKPIMNDENRPDPNGQPNIVQITEDKAELEDSVERLEQKDKQQNRRSRENNHVHQNSKEASKNRKRKGKSQKRKTLKTTREASKSIDQSVDESEDNREQQEHHKKRNPPKSVVIMPHPNRTPIKDRLRVRTKDK